MTTRQLFIFAATRGNKRTAKLLVSRYPDCCEQVDINGNNALHLFMMQRRIFISLLKIPWMNVGALINEKNVEGQTPLHLLAHSQLRYRLAYIKNKKVDKMILNNQNFTAIDVISSAEDLFGHKVCIVRHLKRAKARAGPLLRQKTMSKDKDNKDEDNNERKRNKGLDVSFLKKASNSHLLVATLVATVSFGAGFTLPGGPVVVCDCYIVSFLWCTESQKGAARIITKLGLLVHPVGYRSNDSSIRERRVHHGSTSLRDDLFYLYHLHLRFDFHLIHCGTPNSTLRMPEQDYVGKYV
ncbi:hypothetical protein CK203_060171 [Vitis vinifera]|uniref:PGG domain-containing protein n=1 Tax=Vitis vinifera TaxID=29760 RepID=A0A438GMF3_VITVI|nr:hypothetical protein CK203_060171 [Vitis vinifera]